MVTCGRFISKQLCPRLTHQVEALAEAPSLAPYVRGPACHVCGVIIIDFQHPNLSDGSSSGSCSRAGSGKTLRHVYFEVELGKKYFCTSTSTAVVLPAISGTAIRQLYFQVKNWGKFIWYCCCASSDKRHGNINRHLRTIYFETATSMSHTSGRSLRGGSVPLFIPPLLPFPPSHPPRPLRPRPCVPCVPCVELSELTPSTPIEVKRLYVSYESCSSTPNNIRIRTWTEDRSADFASADPHTRDGIPSCVSLLLCTYLPLIFKHSLQI